MFIRHSDIAFLNMVPGLASTNIVCNLVIEFGLKIFGKTSSTVTLSKRG